MNIFFTDYNPIVAANSLCDQHVNKMSLESSQLISTWLWVKYRYSDAVTMTPTHQGHPCQKWLLESDDNVNWLIVHLEGLIAEKIRRSGRRTPGMIRYEGIISIGRNFVKSGTLDITDPALAVAEEFKSLGDPINCYRQYYSSKQLTFKRPMIYTNTTVPQWLALDRRTVVR